MRKSHVKLVIWALLLCIVSALGVVTIGGIANLLAYFQRGADPASALHIVPNVPPDLYVDLEWHPDDAETGRALEPFARTQLESAYLRAWLQWNLSFVKGEPFGLKTYFSGPALDAAGAAVTTATAQGLRVEQADTEHHLRLHFYSADGAIVSLTDHSATLVQVIRDRTGALVYAGESVADFDVVLMLEDGNWRVRHWVRRAPTQPLVVDGTSSCADCVAVTASGGLQHGGQPLAIAGINYYPSATPWDLFWASYSPAVIDRDFTRIKGLGLNTVRIFVPYAQFGGPKVDPEMTARLRDLLDRAQMQQLHVVVTLFDFKSDYGLLHWPDADRHLTTLLGEFAANPAILAWDLKNEPDLDYDTAGRDVVNAWLEHIARRARAADPNHLLTIGWSSAAAATQLADAVDVVQFHYYGLAADLPDAYASVRGGASAKPVLLGEFGLPTWNSVFPHGHTEAEQAAYYADIRAALRGVDSAGYMAWTLYDFSSVPSSVAGRWPWQTGPQRHLGVLRADESAKPAAALLAPDARLDVPRAPGWQRFLKPFWLALGAGGFGGLVVGLWVGRRVVRRFRRVLRRPKPLPPPAVQPRRRRLLPATRRRARPRWRPRSR